jgi:hypothetical protein
MFSQNPVKVGKVRFAPKKQSTLVDFYPSKPGTQGSTYGETLSKVSRNDETASGIHSGFNIPSLKVKSKK